MNSNNNINSGAAVDVGPPPSSSQSSLSEDKFQIILSELKKINDRVGSLETTKQQSSTSPIPPRPTSPASNIQAAASSAHLITLPTSDINPSQLLSMAKDKNLQLITIIILITLS